MPVGGMADAVVPAADVASKVTADEHAPASLDALPVMLLLLHAAMRDMRHVIRATGLEGMLCEAGAGCERWLFGDEVLELAGKIPCQLAVLLVPASGGEAEREGEWIMWRVGSTSEPAGMKALLSR